MEGNDNGSKFRGISREDQVETNTRSATIEVSESSVMLSINKGDFQTIIMDIIQEELDSKIKLLSTIHLFDVNAKARGASRRK